MERQIHYFVNAASGLQHIGQRDIAWIRISKTAAEKGFRLEHFGKILHARLHGDFGAIVDKVQVTLYTDKPQVEHWLELARQAYDERNRRLADLTDEAVEEFYSCTLCVPPGQDVVRADGSFVPVEQLVEEAADDIQPPVLTFDHDHLTEQKIGELFINPAPAQLVHIALRNGNDLTLTANHRVLVDRPEGLTWLPAGKVQPHDCLVDALPVQDANVQAWPYIVDYLPDDYKVADDGFYGEAARAPFGPLRRPEGSR